MRYLSLFSGIEAASVRRLTETECERLQGFPDGHTDVGLSSGARYKALGNSMAVPVIRWIGRQIEAASFLPSAKRASEHRAAAVCDGATINVCSLGHTA